MTKIINFLLFIILVGFFLNSDFFERTFFVNELFSLLGLICGFALIHKKIKRKSIEFYILLFILICIIHLILSIPRKTNWYFYARNSVIFYSVFSFYFGKLFFPYFNKMFFKLKSLLRVVVAYGLLIQNTILARYSGPILFPLLLRKVTNTTVFSLIIIITLHGFIYDALSVTFLAIMSLLFWIIPSYNRFKLYAFLSICLILFSYVYFHDNLLIYKAGKYSYFGNLYAVYESHFLLSIDHNTSWRFVLWYRFVVENFPQNILGIGFGTPLLHYIPEVQTASNVIDEVHAHVSGAHNTFITLFTRLGIFGLLILLKICSIVFKLFYRIKRANKNSSYLPYFLVWIVIFSLGLFNLCLESPLRASIFWMSLGFIAKIKELTAQNIDTTA